MPNSDGSDAPRKKTTRKAVARKVSSRGRVSEVQTVSRVRRQKKVEAEKEKPKPKADEATTERVRKAPTPIATNRAAQKQKNKQLMVVVSLIVIGFGSSIGVSMLDSGQINVNETIEARNERLKNNQANEADTMFSTETVGVQDTAKSQKADGGLRGLGAPPKPEPKPAVSSSTASSTATSTDLTASSTDQVSSSIVESVEEETEMVGEGEEVKQEDAASSTEETI